MAEMYQPRIKLFRKGKKLKTKTNKKHKYLLKIMMLSRVRSILVDV
jgi:hypothetical protein